jgi:hypothetical protein
MQVVAVFFRVDRRLEPKAGIEPATRALRMRCSTSELLRRRAMPWEENLYGQEGVCHPLSAFPRRIWDDTGKILLASGPCVCFMTGLIPMPEILQKAKQLWQRVPFRHVLLVTIFLSFWNDDQWGQQYPFTNFPMYSHLDAESDVLYVTDQADKVLPFHTMFGTKLSTQKKEFIKKLARICNKEKRDTRDALPSERQKAGSELVEELMPRLKKGRIPPGVDALRFHYKVFRAEGDKITETAPQLVAERRLEPVAG